MKSSAVAQMMTSFRFTVSVKMGPDRGKSYQLLPPKVTIGRDTGNDIVLSDLKVSRNQAYIEFRNDGVVIVDLSSRAALIVNGEAVSEAHLHNGDRIRIGETELLFRMDTVGVPANVPKGAAPHLAMAQPYRLGGAADPTPQPSRRSSADNGRLRFYIIVLGLGGLFAWLMMGETVLQKKDNSLRTIEEIEAEIKGSEQRQEQFVRQRKFGNESEKRRYEEAQSHYLQGFRDFQKGNYSRAIKSFETSRAIDPSHDLAKRYYTLALRARDEFVVSHILEGKKYRERLMYNRCASSLNAAIKALGENASMDIKGKEAMALKNECETLQEGRF
jgi:pSer/pThr/pTyr-binding forkhead associated (FHA) protein